MKGKIITGRGLTGLTKYVNKSDAEHLSGSCRPADFLRTAAALRSQRPDVRQAAIHISISMPPGQPLTHDQWRKAGQILMREMQMQDLEFQLIRHRDTAHDHCHLVACKIKPSGEIWNDSHSARRLHKACERIEQELGLQHTLTWEEQRQQRRDGKAHKPMSDGALRQFQRTGTIPAKTKEAITRRIANERKNNDRAAHPQPADRDDHGQGIPKIPRSDDRRSEQAKSENQNIGRAEADLEKVDRLDENRVPCFLSPPRPPAGKLPPTLKGKLENRAAERVENAYDLRWAGRDQPTFRWHSDSGEIQLLARPTAKNVEVLFELARESGLQPPLKICGSKEFQLLAVRHAIEHNIAIEPPTDFREVRELYKQMTAEHTAAAAAAEAAARAAAAQHAEDVARWEAAIEEQDREKAEKKSNYQRPRM
jgi:hypothetical protein